MKKIVVAIDSFKGCLTSAEADQAASEGVLERMPDAKVVQVPVSDGGEGFLDAFKTAMGGEIVEVSVKDPLMRTIVAQYLVQGDTAVIEIAKASGLTLLSPEERNPVVATSYGTGQLVVDAVRRGCKHAHARQSNQAPIALAQSQPLRKAVLGMMYANWMMCALR